MRCWSRLADAFVSSRSIGPFALLMFLLLAGCSSDEKGMTDRPGVTPDESTSTAVDYPVGIQTEPLGEAPNGGGDVMQYIMTNSHGMQVTLINIGASIVAVDVPDREGTIDNVVLTFNDWNDYLINSPYMGCICGQYANRIANGRFTLDGKVVELDVNNGPNHLHGGEHGFSRMLWTGKVVSPADPLAVKFDLTSASDDAYPGELRVSVTYTLTESDELKIDYEATSDAATVLNLTNHAYWNLGGSAAEAGDILDHMLELNCSRYLPVDETLIPTGELAPVAKTPLDFTTSTTIGARIAEVPGGYDHCFVIDAAEGESASLKKTARVRHPKTGRIMEVETTEPGVQLYTGNFLDGSPSNGGYTAHQGFCLECQHFPDSPNRPDFPTTTIQPGEVYRQTTIYRFSVEPAYPQ